MILLSLEDIPDVFFQKWSAVGAGGHEEHGSISIPTANMLQELKVANFQESLILTTNIPTLVSSKGSLKVKTTPVQFDGMILFHERYAIVECRKVAHSNIGLTEVVYTVEAMKYKHASAQGI